MSPHRIVPPPPKPRRALANQAADAICAFLLGLTLAMLLLHWASCEGVC